MAGIPQTTLAAFLDEFEKIARMMQWGEHIAHGLQPGAVVKAPGILESAASLGRGAMKGLHSLEDPIEVGGLGILAAPSLDNMIARRRARKAGLADEHGEVSEANLDRYRLIKGKYHDPIEAGGLGLLAAPIIAKRLHGGK